MTAESPPAGSSCATEMRTLRGLSSSSGSTVLATPQSMTYTRPCEPIITFEGLRSRWMTPRPCANATASQTRPKTSSSACSSSSVRRAAASSVRRLASVSPSTSFIKNQRGVPSSPIPSACTGTMLG